MFKYLHNSQQQLTALTERKIIHPLSDLKDLPFIFLSLFSVLWGLEFGFVLLVVVVWGWLFGVYSLFFFWFWFS